MQTLFLRAHTSHPAARVAVVLGLLLALPVGCSDNPTSPSAPGPRSLTVIIVPVDSGYQATAAAAFSDGSSRNVTPEVQWTSTNTDVAVVSETGRVTPVAAGVTEIRGTYQTVNGSAHLTVAAPPSAPPVASPPPTPPAPNPAPAPPAPEIHRVTVRVRDALDGAAVSDVRITMVAAGQSEGQVGFTNGAGELAMTGAWGASVTVHAQRNGYESQTVQRPVPDAITIHISLKPVSFTLSGTVEEGGTGDSPVPGPLRVEVVDGVNAGRATTVQWDPQINGGPVRYELSNLQPGTFTVRASAPRYFSADKAGRFGVDQGSNRLDFILIPMTGEYSGQLTTVNGPGVTATFFPLGPGQVSRTKVKFQGTAGLPVTVRITNNTVGRLDVLLEDGGGGSDGHTSSSSAAFNHVATLRQTMTYTILILTDSPTGGTLFVRVTSP